MQPTVSAPAQATDRAAITRIAAGVSGFADGDDAVALAAAIARLTGAELMLVEAFSAPLLPAPPGWDWKSLRKQAEHKLHDYRRTLAPEARTVLESDPSVPRALERVVRREHRDLLVVGSSREAPEGRVWIGKRTRQLLYELECALAVAPRGLRSREGIALRRIGVGYDAGPEAEAALALAGSIAAAGGGELRICGVVDDRIPALLRSPLSGLGAAQWQEVVAQHERQLHQQIRARGEEFDLAVSSELARGRPADALLALSEKVDLLVIGSRRWGPVQRVLLGSTGEALMHGAACPVIAVPRPAS